MSVRPTKKQRTISDGVVHGNSATANMVPPPFAGSKGQLTLLMETLVYAHTQNNDGEFLDILSKIQFFLQVCFRSSNNMEAPFCDAGLGRRLHGMLILYLGYLLSSLESLIATTSLNGKIFLSLLLCLRYLYQGLPKNLLISKSSPDEEDPLEEASILIPRIVLEIWWSIHQFKNHETKSLQQQYEHMAVCCQILKSLVATPTFIEKVLKEQPQTQKESFLLSMIAAASNEARENKLRNIDDTFESLTDADVSEVSRLSKLASMALRTNINHPCVRDGVTDSTSLQSILCLLSLKDRVFFWKCITYFHIDIDKICLMIADCAAGDLFDYLKETTEGTTNGSHAIKQTMECWSVIIQRTTWKRFITIMETISANLLLEKDNVNDGDNDPVCQRHFILSRCFHTCMNRRDVPHIFLQMKNWDGIFRLFVTIATKHQDSKFALTAAKIVVQILRSFIVRHEEVSQSSLLFCKCIEILPELLLCREVWVVEKALDFLQIIILEKRKDFEKTICSEKILRDLIYGLAGNSMNDYISRESKQKLFRIFSVLILEVRRTNFLAREPKILDCLIDITGDPHGDTEGSDCRSKGVFILLKLTRNPCNRRILAKHPGLLASLIRYIRTVPDGNINNNNVLEEGFISRKEMKKQIFLLAKAL